MESPKTETQQEDLQDLQTPPPGDMDAKFRIMEAALNAIAWSHGYANMDDWMAKDPPITGDPDYDPPATGYNPNQSPDGPSQQAALDALAGSQGYSNMGDWKERGRGKLSKASLTPMDPDYKPRPSGSLACNVRPTDYEPLPTDYPKSKPQSTASLEKALWQDVTPNSCGASPGVPQPPAEPSFKGPVEATQPVPIRIKPGEVLSRACEGAPKYAVTTQGPSPAPIRKIRIKLRKRPYPAQEYPPEKKVTGFQVREPKQTPALPLGGMCGEQKLPPPPATTPRSHGMVSTGDPGPQLPRIPNPGELRQRLFNEEYHPVQDSLPMLRRLWHAVRKHGMSADFSTWLQHYHVGPQPVNRRRLHQRNSLPQAGEDPTQESPLSDPSEDPDLCDPLTMEPLWDPALDNEEPEPYLVDNKTAEWHPAHPLGTTLSKGAMLLG